MLRRTNQQYCHLLHLQNAEVQTTPRFLLLHDKQASDGAVTTPHAQPAKVTPLQWQETSYDFAAHVIARRRERWVSGIATVSTSDQQGDKKQEVEDDEKGKTDRSTITTTNITSPTTTTSTITCANIRPRRKQALFKPTTSVSFMVRVATLLGQATTKVILSKGYCG